MNRWAKYDPATGEIIAIVHASASTAALQARDGLEVVAWPDDLAGDDTTHRIEAGEVVPQ